MKSPGASSGCGRKDPNCIQREKSTNGDSSSGSNSQQEKLDEDFDVGRVLRGPVDHGSSAGGQRSVAGSGSSPINTGQKRPGQISLMNDSVTANQNATMRIRKKGKSKQTTSIDQDQEGIEAICQHLTQWLSDASIPFSAARSDSFKVMIESIRRFGPGFELPTYDEMGGRILNQRVADIDDLMKRRKEGWAKFGCSVLLDGWIDKRDKIFLNILVNSHQGTMFLESVDASLYMYTGEKLLDLLENMVEEIGERNVVQVITDPRYAVAGKLLEAKQPHLYWTPCASHCIDLMLEDIGRLPEVKNTLKKAITLNSFIHHDTEVLNMMRQFINRKQLVRPGMTRVITSLLTLKNMHKHKAKLKLMFTNEKWLNSIWAKDNKGKEAQETVHMPSFWNGIVYVLKATTPLLRILRLVNNEKKPAMGYLYQAMDSVKEEIKIAFDEKAEKYKLVFDIIDTRWNCQLGRPLHAAGYLLNPEFYYSHPNIQDVEVAKGFHDCVVRLVPDENEQDKIMEELLLYKEARGTFGMELAIQQRKTKAPVEWWRAYGGSSLNLRRLAIRILSLTCSSWGCDHNWSMFDHIDAEERRNLKQKQLNDLVYVRSNLRLKERFKHLDTIDPISLKDIDDGSEWLVGWTEEDVTNDKADENDIFSSEDAVRTPGIGDSLNSRTVSQVSALRTKTTVNGIGDEVDLEHTNEEEYFEQENQSFDYGDEEDDFTYLMRMMSDTLS